MNKILITGASGKLGKAVIESLLKKLPANQLFALVRDEGKASDLKEKGVNLRIGDYDDKLSLEKAMEGINKVLLISGGGAKNGLEQHKNVIDAAKIAGVKCIAYTGRSLKDRNTLVNKMMQRHFETEDYIIESGLNYILFRNSLYMDTLIFYLGEKVFDTGIYLPASNGVTSFALRSDQGEAIGKVLAEGDCENKIYNFTNVETYSMNDVASALSELSGKQVTYNPIELEDYKIRMQKFGAPEFVTTMIGNFMTDIKLGQEEVVSHDLEMALGRKPFNLKEGLKIMYNL